MCLAAVTFHWCCSENVEAAKSHAYFGHQPAAAGSRQKIIARHAARDARGDRHDELHIFVRHARVEQLFGAHAHRRDQCVVLDHAIHTRQVAILGQHLVVVLRHAERIEQGLEPVVDVAALGDKAAWRAGAQEQDVQIGKAFELCANERHIGCAIAAAHGRVMLAAGRGGEQLIVFFERAQLPKHFELGRQRTPKLGLVTGRAIGVQSSSVAQHETHAA